MPAFDPQGQTLGTILAVHNFGAGDLLELKPAAGGDTVFVPFTEEAVPEIDVAGRRVVIDYRDRRGSVSHVARDRADPVSRISSLAR